jgi:hypothetical protein
VFDDTFLAQALDCYGSAGWPELARLQRTIATLHTVETKRFVGSTLLAVAGAVADELWRVETVVAMEARREWQAAVATATQHLARFTRLAKPINARLTNALADRELADAVYAKCVSFSAKLRRYRKLGEKMEDRVRHEGSARTKGYVRTGYQLQWFELYASPQREVWAEMATLMHELDDLFPPAVLVLERMEPDLDRPRRSASPAQRQHEVEQLMYDTLIEIRQIANDQLATLSEPGLSRHVTAALAAMRAQPIELPRTGLEGAIIAAGLEAPPEANRVLMDAALLRRVIDRLSAEPSWRSVVARRYVLALEAALDEVRANAQAWDRFWGVITWATAMLSLLALMALFPFGTAAAAPALIAALTFAGTVATALTIVVMIHEIIGTIAQSEQTAADLRTVVFRLAQHDPLALFDVANTLARSDKLRAALTTELVTTLVTLAVASKLKLFALALELDGFLSDVDDLFHPPELAP